MELILGIGLQVAAQLRALDGDVLHLLRINLVEQVRVRDLRILAADAIAAADNTPQQHQADEDEDPEHDGFNGRIHQDSSFPAGEKPLTRTSITAYSFPLDVSTAFFEAKSASLRGKRHLCFLPGEAVTRLYSEA